MRGLIIVLAALTVSGCASVADRTARSSGVGIGAPATPAKAAPAVEGDYRAALYQDLQSATQ